MLSPDRAICTRSGENMQNLRQVIMANLIYAWVIKKLALN